MLSASSLLTLAAAISSASAAFQGFNYGSTGEGGTMKSQADFETEFKTASGLEGTDGKFNSARLYTMIQGDSQGNQPISAIPAAIKTKTSLLLGLWASAGQAAFDAEIEALKNTINQYCGQLDGLIAGISVGSEDLYRISPTGIAAGENPGVGPDVLVKYIKEVRNTVKGSCLSDIPIGHVDTWNAYSNDSNNALIEACDWLGMDTYPYYEDTKDNHISEGLNLFNAALEKVKNAGGGGKEVWITETGWPTSGKTYNKAIPSKENARTFWEDVGCPLFGETNVWWFTLQDANFGVVGTQLTEKPVYDLSCKNVKTDKSKTTVGKGSQKEAVVEKESEKEAVSDSDPASFIKPLPSQAPSGVWANSSSNATATSTHSDNGQGSATLAPTASASSGSGSGSGSGSSEGAGGSATPSAVPQASGNQLNSFGAAAVALVLAAAVL